VLGLGIPLRAIKALSIFLRSNHFFRDTSEITHASALCMAQSKKIEILNYKVYINMYTVSELMRLALLESGNKELALQKVLLIREFYMKTPVLENMIKVPYARIPGTSTK